MLAEALHHEPLPTPEALKIYVSPGRDSVVFGLEVRSWRWLRQQFPEARIAWKVSIGRDKDTEQEIAIQAAAPHVLSLLISVPADHLAGVGVREIHVLDVDSEEIVDQMALGAFT